MSLTYVDYLKINDLLSLQHPLSKGPEHDEMLFIIVHQVYELWFKQIMHELEHFQGMLAENQAPQALHTLRRLLTIWAIQVTQFSVLETMTPVDFLSFREALDTASGFQSYQYRELEFLLGFKNPRNMLDFPEGSPERIKVEKRFQEPTIWDSFLKYLALNGYDIPQDLLNRDVTKSVEPSEAVQKILVDIYRNDHATARICERLVDFDEGFQNWRYRHVQVTCRTIGDKKGTGGSTGVEYLKSNLFRKAFPDLWAIRTLL